MQTKRDRLIFLHRIPMLSRQKIYQLQAYDPTLQTIFNSTPSEVSQLLHIPMKHSISIYQTIRNSSFINQIKKDEDNITIITQEDEAYPDSLRDIPDAPLVLYLVGDQTLLQSNYMLSVIGTRKPSEEAFQKLSHIVKPLIKAGWIIVSGLAYGIDSYAHELTVQNHEKTIAVLGSGFYHIYPKAHTNLCRRIARNGLLVSEYPPIVQPRKHHFPERNRIISGLSEGTLVIEAAEKSGTMITVDQALDQGKDIYAVPGSPIIPQTIGCNRLIQDGAKLVISATDILEEWPINQV